MSSEPPLPTEPITFKVTTGKTSINRDGSVTMTLVVPNVYKYDAIRITDIRDKLWEVTFSPPPVITDQTDLDAEFAMFFGEEE